MWFPARREGRAVIVWWSTAPLCRPRALPWCAVYHRVKSPRRHLLGRRSLPPWRGVAWRGLLPAGGSVAPLRHAQVRVGCASRSFKGGVAVSRPAGGSRHHRVVERRSAVAPASPSLVRSLPPGEIPAPSSVLLGRRSLPPRCGEARPFTHRRGHRAVNSCLGTVSVVVPPCRRSVVFSSRRAVGALISHMMLPVCICRAVFGTVRYVRGMSFFRARWGLSRVLPCGKGKVDARAGCSRCATNSGHFRSFMSRFWVSR